MPPPTNAQIRSINLDGSDAQILVIMLRIAADYEELAEWAEKTQYLGGCRL